MSVNQQYTDQIIQPGGATIPGVVSGGTPSSSSSGASPVTPISQAHIDAFQQLQQRSMETIRTFTTQPMISGRNGRRGDANAGQQPATEGQGAQQPGPINTGELYDIMYSRNMNRIWADAREEWSSSSEEGDGDERYDEDGDHVDSGNGGDDGGDEQDEEDGPQNRSSLFGGTRGIDSPQQASRNRQKRQRLPPTSQMTSDMDEEEDGDDDDNPRPRKRCQREYSSKHRHECFLCAWGNKFHDGIAAPHVNKLIEIIDNNYGVHHNREIANELHLYFKYEVYDPASGMQMLTREIALEHIEGMHTLNARIFLGESIKQEKQLSYLFLNAIWRPDPVTGGYTFDKVAADQYRKSQKALRELYLMPLNKMNFSNGNNAEDLKRAANYMNLMMPRFEQKPQRVVQQPRRARQPRPGSDAPPEDSSVPVIRKRFG